MRSPGDFPDSSDGRSQGPLAQETIPSPAMKTESTIETMAEVTPNCAMARRSQTNSYRTLQKPEKKKKMKNQFTKRSVPRFAKGRDPQRVSARDECKRDECREIGGTRQG